MWKSAAAIFVTLILAALLQAQTLQATQPVAARGARIGARAARDRNSPPFTTAADVYSGISGPGEPVQGNGGGGWRSGKGGVQYKGPHPKPGWQLDWDEKQWSTDLAIDSGLLPPIKPLVELHLRDTSMCLGGDGMYYMTGSSGDNIWDKNDGIELWKSADLKKWDYVGLVWSFAKDATWAKDSLFVWAPEIHFVKGNYILSYCVSGGRGGGSGLLKSTTGKPEGPYVNPFTPDARAEGGIDATIFEDNDGKAYYTWGRGAKIYPLKDDLSGFADQGHDIRLDPDSAQRARSVGGIQTGVASEGASLFKHNGKYYLGGAMFVGGVNRTTGKNGRYSSGVAISDNIYGPYHDWHEAVPCGAGGNYFQDKQGNWFCTYFGNDEASPFREKPGLVKIDFAPDGKIIVADEQPAFILRDGAPTHWRTAIKAMPATQPK